MTDSYFFVSFANDDIGPFDSARVAAAFGQHEAGDDHQVCQYPTGSVFPASQVIVDFTPDYKRGTRLHMAADAR